MERATLLAIPTLCVGIALMFSTLPAQAATTEVHVVKYASDNTTILNNTTVTYEWIEANLPVQGDGVIHYYHQGPMFGEKFESDPWDVNETTNLKDKGAVKGTDVGDLCDLVGGMSAGDEIKIRASDGFYKRFGYTNVYEPQSRQGPIVLCWYKDGDYIPDYEDGMQIVFFADDNTFGNWDMHESLAPEYRYNYSSSHPSTNGLSVKWISEIAIYSTMEAPELSSIEVSPVEVTLDIGDTQQFNATGYDQYSTEISNIIFTWASSNETVGTIDGNGLFVANANGTATVEAVNGTVNGTATVMVFAPTPTPTPTPSSNLTTSKVLTAITVRPAAVTLNVGETQRFAGEAYDQNHHKMLDINLQWMSSNETVGTIDDAGFFTALCAGGTLILAENETATGVADVAVSRMIPAPALTETVSADVTSTMIPAPALTETVSADVTSTPSTTPARSPPPSPSTTPAPVQTSTPVPAPSVQGFEALSAISGLLAIAYMIKWRK